MAYKKDFVQISSNFEPWRIESMNVIPYPDPYGVVKDNLVQLMALMVFFGAAFLFMVRYLLRKHKSEQLDSLSKRFLYKDFQEMWQDFTSNVLMCSCVFVMGIVAIYFLTYAAEVRSTFNCAVYANAMDQCHSRGMSLGCMEGMNFTVGYGQQYDKKNLSNISIGLPSIQGVNGWKGPAVVNNSYPKKGVNDTEELGAFVVPQPSVGYCCLVNIPYRCVCRVPVSIRQCLVACAVIPPDSVRSE